MSKDQKPLDRPDLAPADTSGQEKFTNPDDLIRYLEKEKERLTSLKEKVNKQANERVFEVIDQYKDVLLKANPSRLYIVENIFPGALTHLFLDPPSHEDNIKKGKVDFGNADLLESIIGLGDFLNFKAAYVRVIDAKGKVYYGCRKDNIDFLDGKRRGFVNFSGKNASYIAIFTGSTFEEITKEEYEKNIKKSVNPNSQTVDANYDAIDQSWIDTIARNEEKLKKNIKTDPEKASSKKDKKVITKKGSSVDPKMVALASADIAVEEMASSGQDTTKGLKGEALWDNPQFHKAVVEMCARLGIQPQWLKEVMDKESGISATARNPYSTKATGLIQFTKDTAPRLGTTIYSLRRMSGLQQLKYVEKFLRPYSKQIKSKEDLYMAIFYPAAIDKDSNFRLGSEKSDKHARKVARQNPGMRVGKYVTRQNALDWAFG